MDAAASTPTQDDRPTAQEIFEAMRSILWSKQTWINDHSSGPKRRPDHEVDHARRQVRILKFVCESYEGRFGGDQS